MLNLVEIDGDITKLVVDAIVNAANLRLLPGGGVDGAIHEAAGPELARACSYLGGCRFGEAKITLGYNLPAKYVIHTVAPILGHHDGHENEILYDCFLNSLILASRHSVSTIAFPAIGCGLHGNSYDTVLFVARRALKDFEKEFQTSSLSHVFFVKY